MHHYHVASRHGVGPLVDPFRSHTSGSLFNCLPWFLLFLGLAFFLLPTNVLFYKHWNKTLSFILLCISLIVHHIGTRQAMYV